MTEDWTGLTGDEMAEKLAEALNPFSDIADRELDDGGYWFDPHEALSAVVDASHVRQAAAALASYRAAVVPVLTAEAMPEDDEIEIYILDACNALEAIRGVLPCLPQNAAYRAIEGAAEVGRNRAIEALDAYRLHKEPR